MAATAVAKRVASEGGGGAEGPNIDSCGNVPSADQLWNTGLLSQVLFIQGTLTARQSLPTCARPPVSLVSTVFPSPARPLRACFSHESSPPPSAPTGASGRGGGDSARLRRALAPQLARWGTSAPAASATEAAQCATSTPTPRSLVAGRAVGIVMTARPSGQSVWLGEGGPLGSLRECPH